MKFEESQGLKQFILKGTVLIALWIISFYPVFPLLIQNWLTDSNHSYCILVPFLAAYLIWAKRKELKNTKIQASVSGAFIFAFSMLFYLVSYIGGILFFMRLSMVLSLWGMVLLFWGKDVFKLVRFPMLFLLFLIPVPESVEMAITFPLQLFATRISSYILSILTIPVYREGNMLYFVNSQLEVAEACSGIRSITALLMLATIFVHLMESGILKKLIILISSVPIAMAANILRVTGTGILAHFYGDQVARGFLHEFSGVVVFIIGLAAIYFEYYILGRYFRENKINVQNMKDHVPQNMNIDHEEGTAMPKWSFSLMAAFLIITAISSISIAYRGVPVITALNLHNFPKNIEGYVGKDDYFPQGVYDALKEDETIYRHYVSGNGDKIDLYIGYYGTAKGGRTAHNPYGCLPGGGWGIINSNKVDLIPPNKPKGGSKVRINHILARQGDGYVNMFHWYQTRGTIVINNGIQHNLNSFLGRILYNRNDGAFVQISIFSNLEGIARAQQIGKVFALDVIRLLSQYWPTEGVPSN